MSFNNPFVSLCKRLDNPSRENISLSLQTFCFIFNFFTKNKYFFLPFKKI